MTLLLVAWPAWALRNQAMDNARDADLRVETAEYLEKVGPLVAKYLT